MRAFSYVWSLPSHHSIRHSLKNNVACKLHCWCVLEPVLLPIEVLHCGILLLLRPWPWFDDLYIRTWPVSHGDIPDVQKWTSYVKVFKSYRNTDIETHKRTDRQLTDIHRRPRNYITRSFAGGQWKCSCATDSWGRAGQIAFSAVLCVTRLWLRDNTRAF